MYSVTAALLHTCAQMSVCLCTVLQLPLLHMCPHVCVSVVYSSLSSTCVYTRVGGYSFTAPSPCILLAVILQTCSVSLYWLHRLYHYSDSHFLIWPSCHNNHQPCVWPFGTSHCGFEVQVLSPSVELLRLLQPLPSSLLILLVQRENTPFTPRSFTNIIL